ncbi:MAG: toxin-antitoxin system YwqK family antitoxin [Saprospiraceae bacterium]|nr:toxin-antitoxin system YwqK family antitoxin [Saprospiraceae bacterium]
MKNLLLLVLVALLSSCNSTESTPAPDFSIEGFEKTTIPGTATDYLVRSDVYDRMLEEGMLLNGKKHGLWITYHDSEKQIPAMIANYVNGKLNGATSEYNNRGGLTSLKHYTNDVLNGRSILYSNGRLVEVADYKDGELHGVRSTYFERSDQKQTEVHFKDGKQDGTFRYYNEQGAIVMEYLYKDGEKISGGIVEPAKEEAPE